ncbi:iron-sulfur cluster biosynthesis family protein [Brevibacillus dissolubilis]|uniref:iron-sulfur cluster biosynthesis family protein n=1 Tax=Brevibacillus dissolubilis TaxID=1844116 RepID=UPI001115EC7D|nr:iron-sulfur cluster biosynthesis family protein [Brevibacillus dissolubilis]
MNIEIKESAALKLKAAAKPSEDKIVRILGEIVGGCGMTVEYSLVWDEPAANDRLIEGEGFTLAIDPETEGYMDTSGVKLEYYDNQGYRLTTPAQIIAYGLRLKDRW